MPYKHDPKTNSITIPQGDTADIDIRVTGAGITDGDTVLFRVRNIREASWAMTKAAIIEDGVAQIRITNADTNQLLVKGRYGWTIGVVKGIDYDANDNPAANDDTDDVLTVFNDLKEFIVAPSGVLPADE